MTANFVRLVFDVSKTRETQKVEEFVTILEKSPPGLSVGNALEGWDYLRDAVHTKFIHTYDVSMKARPKGHQISHKLQKSK